MDCSNCGNECSFVKSGFCKTDRECPFYVETWWQLEGNPNPKLIKDCFPKKFALEQNNLLHRFLCMQSVVEDVRNRMAKLESMLEQLMQQSHEFLLEKRLESLNSKEKNISITPINQAQQIEQQEV